jgi:hypothetical protein
LFVVQYACAQKVPFITLYLYIYLFYSQLAGILFLNKRAQKNRGRESQNIKKVYIKLISFFFLVGGCHSDSIVRCCVCVCVIVLFLCYFFFLRLVFAKVNIYVRFFLSLSFFALFVSFLPWFFMFLLLMPLLLLSVHNMRLFRTA